MFITGDFTRLCNLVNEPLASAKSFEDKLPIYNNLVRALTASGKLKEAFNQCVDVLSQLGQNLPSESSPSIFKESFVEVKALLHEKSIKDIVSLPEMKDERKLVSSCASSRCQSRYCLLTFPSFFVGYHAAPKPNVGHYIHFKATVDTNHYVPYGKSHLREWHLCIIIRGICFVWLYTSQLNYFRL